MHIVDQRQRWDLAEDLKPDEFEAVFNRLPSTLWMAIGQGFVGRRLHAHANFLIEISRFHCPKSYSHRVFLVFPTRNTLQVGICLNGRLRHAHCHPSFRIIPKHRLKGAHNDGFYYVSLSRPFRHMPTCRVFL